MPNDDSVDSGSANALVRLFDLVQVTYAGTF